MRIHAAYEDLGDDEKDRVRLLLTRRHQEWVEHQLTWRWLLDSYEGGERYRNAVYGWDTLGTPVRNLIRHKREYPDPRELPSLAGAYPGLSSAAGVGSAPGQMGSDAAAMATNDDYELRRARTPVPGFTAEAIHKHLDEVYAREVSREGPDDLKAWWADVDGCGTPVDRWMEEAVAPLLMLFGHLDLVFDHPPAPDGAAIDNQADVRRLGLDRCVAAYILPENMLWWRLDPAGRYEECVTLEYCEADAGPAPRYRHWTAERSVLYADFELDEAGEKVRSGADVLAVIPHPFGRVPIVRVFDRKKPRCRNVGQPRYEGVAERQREYYNRDSELILSDTTQAHPLLQGPEDFVQADGTIPIGPNWLLPKKKNAQGGAVSYEGFDVVEFAKDGAESIRRNKADIRDDVDRETCQTKPAGAAGTDGRSVGQSGLSKRLDQKDGTRLLARIGSTLRRAEEVVAEMALTVLRDSPPGDAGRGAVAIGYPKAFDLFSLDELCRAIPAVQAMLAASGAAPELEAALIGQVVRELRPGLSDEEYEAFDAEVRAKVDANAGAMGGEVIAPPAGAPEPPPDPEAPGDSLQDAGEDPAVRPMRAASVYP